MSNDQVLIRAEVARPFCQDCCPLPEFLQAMDGMIDDLKSTPRAEGVDEIWMPGEMEMRKREERLRNGFPVGKVVLDEVRAAGDECGVKWPGQ